VPNQRIEEHPLVGTRHTYRAKFPQYVPAADQEPATPITSNGHHFEILAVFANWNDVARLDTLYVRCEETGQSTHVTPANLGLPELVRIATTSVRDGSRRGARRSESCRGPHSVKQMPELDKRAQAFAGSDYA
jgi:hypothetical protein